MEEFEFQLPHETLDAHAAALEVARGCGAIRGGDAGRNQYRIASGSAAAACAVLGLVGTPEVREHQAKLRRVGALLHGLQR
ncbi:MAG: hypothetical protein FJ090_01870 [Deltaproteobacteria bacterium]|nr:hypothetical protein [Deltaproteobacteria bacterium]